MVRPGERNLVRVESVDKVERSTLAVDCTEANKHRAREDLQLGTRSPGDTIRETRQTEARRKQR